MPSILPGRLLTDHFFVYEFACNCCGQIDLVACTITAEHLEKVRAFLGRPLTICSGYRCAIRNAQVRGDRNSAHLRGLAADIRVCSDAEMYTLANAALSVGTPRIGIGELYVHLDWDTSLPTKQMWTYYARRVNLGGA